MAKNQYVDLFDSEIGKDFKELKDEYKAARKVAKTRNEKVILMKAYADDLIDLAVDARISGEFELNSELNTIIQALSRRTYSGKRSW
tara:strand:- start:148 stop:408 length:261 start_codon:yes stop_codon:yes gene_type:complete